MRKLITLAAITMLMLNLSIPALGAWFPIYDNENVVFLGDSITEQRLYTSFIEAYTIGRFPTWKLQFRNAGWGGDTAEGALKRLDRDVVPLRPKLVIVAFGMNDGKYSPFDQAVCDAYINNQKKIAEALKAKEVARFVYLGPGAVETGKMPFMSPVYPETLKKMSDTLAEICKAGEYIFVDCFTSLDKAAKEYKAKNAANSFIPDGVHPNIAGHLVMAYAALEAMDAPALVADITIGIPSLNARALNAQVREAEMVGDGIKMKIEEKSLPMFVPEEAKPAMEFVPVLSRLNREMLTVNGLNPGSYDLKIDGKQIGTFTDVTFAKGINLTLYPTPAWEQAGKLWDLIVRKNNAYFERWRSVQLYEMPSWMDANIAEPMRKAALDRLDKEIADLEAQISQAAKPVPHLFEIVPTPKPEPS